MSLINDVLRDLDRRAGSGNGGPGVTAHAVAVQRRRRKHRSLAVGAAALCVAVGAALLVLGQVPRSTGDAVVIADVPANSKERASPEDPVAKAEDAPAAEPDPVVPADPHPELEAARKRAASEAGPKAVSTTEAESEAEPEAATVADAEPGPQVETAPAMAIADEDARAEASAAPAPEPDLTEQRELTAEAHNAPEVRIERRTDATEQQARRLYRRALAALDEDDVPRARGLLADALEATPELHAARELLGGLLLEAGDVAAAGRVLHAGLELRPDHPGLARRYARVLMQSGATGQAIELLADTLPRDPGDGSNHALLAALYRDQGRPADAVPVYRDLVRAHPDQAVWWLGLGLSLEESGEAARALAAYRRTLQAGGLDMELSAFVQQQITALESAQDG